MQEFCLWAVRVSAYSLALFAAFLATPIQAQAWRDPGFGRSVPASPATSTVQLRIIGTVAQPVQAILGIPAAGAGHLEELAGLIGTPMSDRQAREIAVKKLIDALMRGGPPDAFARLILTYVNVKGDYAFQKGPGWRYGTIGDRNALVRYLWDTAQLRVRASPEQAQRYARAALLLAAHEGLPTGDLMLFTVYADPDRFHKMAALDEAQAKALDRLLVPILRNTERDKAGNRYVNAEAELIDNPRADTSHVARRALDAVRDEWMAGRSYYDVYQTLGHALRLRLLVHERKLLDVEAQVSAALLEWKEHSSGDDTIERWLGEVMTLEGQAPKYPLIFGPGYESQKKQWQEGK